MSEPLILDSFGLSEQKNFAFKNSAKAFKILSDSLYMDKVQAVIRELSTNAYDSHIDAGKVDKPFEIHLPCPLNPFFSIRDFGTGMDHETITNRYTTYFDSSKTERQDVNGTLGLGSKSPMALADEFAVTSFIDGTARSYFVFKDDQGFPSISLVNEFETPEENGIEIKIGIRGDIIDDFKVKAPLALYHFEPAPIIHNSNLVIKRESKILSGKNDDWYFANAATSVYGGQAFAFMANVSYPISLDIFSTFLETNEKHLLSLFKKPLRIYFKGREIEHTPSREGIQYTKQTVNVIKERLQSIYDELVDIVKDNFAHCKNTLDILGRINFIKDKSDSSFEYKKNLELWKSQKDTNINRDTLVFLADIFASETLNISNDIPNFNFSNFVSDFIRISVNCFQYNNNLANFTQELNTECSGNYSANEIIRVISEMDLRYLSSSINSNANYYSRQLLSRYILDEDIESSDSINREYKMFLNTNSLSDTNLSIEQFKEDKLKELVKLIDGKSFAIDFIKSKIDVRTVFMKNPDISNTLEPNILDGDRSTFKIAFPFFGCETVLLIDDYAKSKITFKNKYFCAYVQNKGYTGYVAISNKSGSRRFTGRERDLYFEICKLLAKKNNINYVFSSEIIAIDEKYFVKEKAAKKAVVKTDLSNLKKLAFNKNGELVFIEATNLTNNFHMKLKDDTFPSLDDENVVFVPKNGGKHILFGHRNLSTITKVGVRAISLNDNEFFFEDLIKLLSVITNENIFEKYTFVEVSTANKIKKIKETSKWTMIEDFIEKTLKSKKAIKKLVAIFGLISVNKFFRSIDSLDSTFNLAVNKLSPNSTYSKTDAIQFAHALCFLLKNKGDKCTEAGKKKLEVFNVIHSRKGHDELITLLSPVIEVLNTCETFKIETPEIFGKFSANGKGEYSYDEANFIVNAQEIFNIIREVSVKNTAIKQEFNRWMEECARLNEKYPAMNFFNPRLFGIDRSSVQKSQQNFELIISLKKEV